MESRFKNFLEIVAGLGFVFSGTDMVFEPIVKAINNPITVSSPVSAPAPAPDLGFLQGLLILIGIILLGHFLYNQFKQKPNQ
ncbi:MAG TPA: hypothetical protein PLS77_05765 [Anaerolineaceae bacterium]|jgi:hypothetical protein|nr:hypothetical protein [Longilinea sp.]HNS63963.1 hypothetical protein [Anaerolineaceae bacterium]HNZ01845.1 hypothetical protein [Anaerolineaceae bacterium]HOD43469.1 hypothetical protein [Anaerolineaceae bacterium]HOH21013.1 hypothetical protein [Anaerolineaceae bacterium]